MTDADLAQIEERLGLLLRVALISGLLWLLTRQDAAWLASVAACLLLGAFVTGWLLRPADAPRSKSIDVGTGILILRETGGPLPQDLRDELDLWQRAGGAGLSRIPWDGGLP